MKEARGTATIEHAGLCALIALALIAAISALLAGADSSGRELGFSLARKIRCAAVGPGPCWQDPLTEAYGRPLAGAVRALAPEPEERPSVAGSLLPVDFRRCRTASCALPGPRSPALTASNRRTTAFVAVHDRRRSDGSARIDYWLYRPTLGWERQTRSISSEEIARLAPTPLLDTDVPALVSLETLPGANHHDFAPGEEPPWRWRIERR